MGRLVSGCSLQGTTEMGQLDPKGALPRKATSKHILVSIHRAGTEAQ